MAELCFVSFCLLVCVHKMLLCHWFYKYNTFTLNGTTHDKDDSDLKIKLLLLLIPYGILSFSGFVPSIVISEVSNIADEGENWGIHACIYTMYIAASTTYCLFDSVALKLHLRSVDLHNHHLTLFLHSSPCRKREVPGAHRRKRYRPRDWRPARCPGGTRPPRAPSGGTKAHIQACHAPLRWHATGPGDPWRYTSHPRPYSGLSQAWCAQLPPRPAAWLQRLGVPGMQLTGCFKAEN